MYKLIKVDNKEIPMEANAATPIRYRLVFNKNLDDLWTGDNPNKSEAIAELCYVMAMSAAKADMSTLSYDGFLEWLADFSGLAFLTAFPEVYELYSGNAETTSTPKKKASVPNGK